MPKTIELICPNCNTIFEKSLCQYNHNKKRGRMSLCSKLCRDQYRDKNRNQNRKNKYSLIKCDNCNKEFNKSNIEIKKYKHHFCCHDCYAKFKVGKKDAQITNKVLKKYYCKKCGKLIGNGWQQTGGRTICDSCPKRSGKNYVDWSKITIYDLKQRNKNKPPSHFHGHIRGLSRAIYKNSNQPYKCKVCGYDAHIEVCHIKPIKDFSEDTSISIVNDIKNLVALCPNHHWELDHGILQL